MESALQLIKTAKKQRALYLDLGSCGLKELPDELFELTWLEALSLSDMTVDFAKNGAKPSLNMGNPNQIATLSDKISQLSSLKKLTIGNYIAWGFELSDISNLAECKSLTDLYISNCPIEDISAFENLKDLQTLVLIGTQIKDISPIKNLTNLQKLILSGNSIENISALEKLINLRELTLTNNQICDTSILKKLTNLQKLILSTIQVESISALEKLVNLKELTLTSAQIGDTSTFKNLINLQKLNLTRTQVSDISTLKNLTHLKELVLVDTLVSNLSPIERLTSLQKLILTRSQVSDVSPLRKLTDLQELNLATNQVSDISTLKSLTNLQRLSLENNQINDISVIQNLTNLQRLILKGTQVSDISALKDLNGLQELDLGGTQVSEITPLLPLLKKQIQVISDEDFFFHEKYINIHKTLVPNIIYDLLDNDQNKKLINYLEQITQPGNPPQSLYEAKLMVVGEPGAGKTSLMNKLLNPNYILPESSDADSTTGINIKSWSFPILGKSQSFQAHIWDFGGQKRQYMTHQFFLTAHTVYILVASNDRKEQSNFPYWFKIINLLGRDNTSNHCSPLIVFLNERESKQDAPVFSFNFDGKLYEDQYPDLQFDNKRFDLNDSAELQAFTCKLQQSLLKLHHIGDPVPAQWINVRGHLRRLAEKSPYISLQDFQGLCCEHGISNEGYQQVFSYRLHTLGSILHFQNDDVLRETIIIDPNWAVDAVYSVLKDGRIEARGGYFSRADLQQIWGNDYSISEQAHLLRLMSYEAFEICYLIDHPEEDGEWYLAPQFLTENSANYSLKSEHPPLKFRFSYIFMPEGIVARLIVRLHENIQTENNKPLAWKTGFILQSNGAQLRVQEREEGGLKVLDMEAGGRTDEQKYIIRRVRDEVDRIHRRWFKGIQVNEMVPCSCSKCKDSNTPHYFNNGLLQRRLDKGRTDIDCDKSIESVAIRGLLEGIYQVDELPTIDRDTDLLLEEQTSKIVNNFSVASGVQLVVSQDGKNQPIIQANEQAQVKATGQVDQYTDNEVKASHTEPANTTAPVLPKKPFYHQWWGISLIVGTLASGLFGFRFSSIELGLLAGGVIFAIMMFFQPGKTYVRAAWLCMMAVISNPLLSGMVGQNPELKDSQLGFVFKINESLPENVLMGLIVLAAVLFFLHSRES